MTSAAHASSLHLALALTHRLGKTAQSPRQHIWPDSLSCCRSASCERQIQNVLAIETTMLPTLKANMTVAFGFLVPRVRLPFRTILRAVIVRQLQCGWLLEHPLHLAVMTCCERTCTEVRILLNLHTSMPVQ